MWSALRTPKWIGRIVGLIGLVTLGSALSPALRDRVGLVRGLLPAVFPDAATTGAAATGVLLVLLSRGLRRAKLRAWLVATVLTAVSVVLHLVKGLDVEEAVISATGLTLLLASRREFTARSEPRTWGRLLAVIVAGPVVAATIGLAWLSADPDGQARSTTTGQRVAEAVLGLVGVPGPVTFLDPSDADASEVALLVLGVVLLAVVLLVALQPADGPVTLTEDQAGRLRGLLDAWGGIDSLGYFALRDDRSVVFSKSGKAAVTYRVIGTVSLAGGDPIGDPEAWPGAIEAWLAQARDFGWIPAVLGASERGAKAFHRAGLDALELGDEAVLELDRFSLEGRSMRGIRQAVSRCDRAGLTVTVHHVRDLDAHVREEVRAKSDAWRDGPVERGFSMALNRLCADQDSGSVVVLCRDSTGELRGLLNFVPWGACGLSLDLMRRERDTENGIVEHMVAALCREAPALGVQRLSLNFAVLRYVFARGEQLGAGPVLRLWRSVLLGLSRFWQIESLYRANAKYQPEWRPRFLCFVDATDLGRVGTAALRAEAFLVAPAWVGRLTRRPSPPSTVPVV